MYEENRNPGKLTISAWYVDEDNGEDVSSLH
jgi:hypothetical protein